MTISVTFLNSSTTTTTTQSLSTFATNNNGGSSHYNNRPSSTSFTRLHHLRHVTTPGTKPPTLSLKHTSNQRNHKPIVARSSSGDNNSGGDDNSGGGGGGEGEDGSGGGNNKGEAILVLAGLEKTLENLPKDLAEAVMEGRIPGSIVTRYFELEKSVVFKWLLRFQGFKERLLADDLFLAKVFMECGVGIFTKTAAEYERRRENFMKELDFVIADVAMAIIADFMLVWLPAPTVALRPPLAVSAGSITRFFYSCPDNAFQVALAGTSYSFLQRAGSMVRNGAKLFAVGTTASLVGTSLTNGIIKARKAVDKSFQGEVEEIPIVSTSVAYGVYMAVSSNLRYQVLAGVIEQRMLEPMLHQHKILLSAVSFAVRTGNTFLGSLLWVDYARLIGIQKVEEKPE